MSYYIRVNMTTGNARIFNLPQEQKFFGGRGRVSQVLYSEMDPAADALSSKNVIVFTIGMLSGVPLSCFDAVYIGTKSPFSKKLVFAQFMSRAARMLAGMGIHYIVFEGLPANAKKHVLVVERSKAYLIPLEELIGANQIQTFGAFRLQETLQQIFGKNSCIIAYGAENLVHSAVSSILVSGSEEGSLKNIISYGISEVLASKGIKAVVIKSNAQVVRENKHEKATFACHELESLLMCSRLHSSLKNTPYGQYNLCLQCMNSEWKEQDNAFESVCTNIGIYPEQNMRKTCILTEQSDPAAFLRKIEENALDANLFSHIKQADSVTETKNQILATFENMGFCSKALQYEQYESVMRLLLSLLTNYCPNSWTNQSMLNLGKETLEKEQAFNSWAVSSHSENEPKNIQLFN